MGSTSKTGRRDRERKYSDSTSIVWEVREKKILPRKAPEYKQLETPMVRHSILEYYVTLGIPQTWQKSNYWFSEAPTSKNRVPISWRD